ncbi:MAG: TetR/AcrR family transcriptional regulator [Alphaproteobacteria bacterium]|nr:TetR/AcrR family transcriptional regulator [Alphaproteobacteria bacterium]
MPWEKNYDETEVLERATYAFWARGYEATSMNNLVEATGINRGSIYAAYTNKHNLFIQALRHYDKVYRADYLEYVARQYAPREAIIVVFEDAAKNTGGEDTPGGCLLVNTMLEMSPHDREVRDFVNNCLQGVEDFFFSRIEAGKKAETVSTSESSRNTARALLGLFLGQRVLARSNADRFVADAVTRQARMMLG